MPILADPVLATPFEPFERIMGVFGKTLLVDELN